MNHIETRIIDSADTAAIVRLYREAGWWRQEYTDDFIPALVRNSFVFVGAFDGETQVGMGRAISDGVSDAYIQDVTVLRDYRGRGIGGQIITTLVNHLRTADIDWIALIGEPGTGNFYRRLGFEFMPNFLPMIYHQQEATESDSANN